MKRLILRDVRLPARGGAAEPVRWDVSCVAGRIERVVARPERSDEAPPIVDRGAEVIEAGGCMLVPALVDAHLHLDLAFSRELVPENLSGTLREAIALWSRAKTGISADNVRERAERAIDAEVGFGTGLIRSHVDVAGAAGLRLAEGVLSARERRADRCEIELVAFPQDGLIRDRAAVEHMREALRMGVERVGGIPHVERTRADGIRQLELVFDIAGEFNRSIDVHIDETDDPYSQFTEELAALTIARGWQGRVTASHACALSSYDDAHAAKVIDLLAEANVAVVTNPGVNLHLQGRHDNYPKRRGLTRVRELLARNIRMAAGQDCICDPFYPLGDGRMLDQAFLLVHADHLGSPDGLCAAYEMVSKRARSVLERPAIEIEPGAAADLAVFPGCATIADLVRMRPVPVCVIHAGSVVHSTTSVERNASGAPRQ